MPPPSHTDQDNPGAVPLVPFNIPHIKKEYIKDIKLENVENIKVEPVDDANIKVEPEDPGDDDNIKVEPVPSQSRRYR